MRTKEQTRHYLLSFPTDILVDWYNTTLVEEVGDYSEQGIFPNSEPWREKIKETYDLKVLYEIVRRSERVYTDSKYIALLGEDKPYIVTFDTFEEFLEKHKDADYFLQFLAKYEENLDELKRMYDEESIQK